MRSNRQGLRLLGHLVVVNACDDGLVADLFTRLGRQDHDKAPHEICEVVSRNVAPSGRCFGGVRAVSVHYGGAESIGQPPGIRLDGLISGFLAI